MGISHVALPEVHRALTAWQSHKQGTCPEDTVQLECYPGTSHKQPPTMFCAGSARPGYATLLGVTIVNYVTLLGVTIVNYGDSGRPLRHKHAAAELHMMEQPVTSSEDLAPGRKVGKGHAPLRSTHLSSTHVRPNMTSHGASGGAQQGAPNPEHPMHVPSSPSTRPETQPESARTQR